MIVDNSIVVIDGYLEYLGKGMGRREAAVKSVQQYFAPMMLATVCICAIFFPLMYTMTGEAHDVMDLFPKTITINLMVSLLVAVAVIPVLNAALIRKVTPAKEGEMKLTDRIQLFYEKTLKWTFKHPWLTMVGAVVLVVATSLIFPTLKMRQFPFADRNQFAVEIFLPEGEGLDRTVAVADSMRRVLQRDERVTSVTSFMGCSSPRFQVSYAPQMGGRNFAQLIVNTPDIQSTFDVLNEYAPKWSNHWPEAYVRFKQMDFLPVPTYEYRFYGNDMDSISRAAELLMAQMRRIPDIEWVHTDYEQPHPVLNVSLDPVNSAQLGINRTTAQLQLAMQTGQMQVGSIWEGNYEVPILRWATWATPTSRRCRARACPCARWPRCVPCGRRPKSCTATVNVASPSRPRASAASWPRASSRRWPTSWPACPCLVACAARLAARWRRTTRWCPRYSPASASRWSSFSSSSSSTSSASASPSSAWWPSP